MTARSDAVGVARQTEGMASTTTSAPAEGVWADLVGQQRSVEVFRRAVGGEPHAMTHAWLITGPPGSGRSNVARAFAAALQCPRNGCGGCQACRTSLSGAHPDVTLVRTEMLSIGVDEVRDLVRRAAMSPTLGRFQVIVVEDADRVTERGADAMLKSIEEPARTTVWLLCAPNPEDVVATIRSRCRLVILQTPTTAAVTRLLQDRDGVEPGLAAYAARVAQGHVGRAAALARDPEARERRAEILRIPLRLRDLGACLDAAALIVQTASADAAAATAAMDERERNDLSEALGFGTKGARPRQAQAAMKDLDEQQKARAKRFQRDAIDRALTELTGFYRDVLSVQLDVGAGLVNEELATEIRALARKSAPEATLRTIDALINCRAAMEANVAPLLAVEAAMIGLVRR